MKSFAKFYLVILSLGLVTACFSQEDRQKYFNELAGSPEWQPDKVIETLAIEKGWHIGDLGAGGGYYTYRFAQETGTSGKVYAADINQEYLVGIDKNASDKGFKNVQTILSSSDDSRFEDKSLDLIFTRNTFHHIDNKNQYMKKLAQKLNPGGKIALIDYKQEASYGPVGHNVTRDEILSSLEDTGLVVEQEYEFLEKQYFFVFNMEQTH